MSDTVDAVIVELKKATVFGKRVLRGWPSVTAMEPCCGVQEVVGQPLPSIRASQGRGAAQREVPIL